MTQFVYQARDHAGRSETGAVTAPSIEDARTQLRRDGRIVVDLHEEFASASSAQLAGVRRKKVKRGDVMFFATQLAVMVDTGVPLAEALDSISEQTDHEGLRVMVGDISDQVKSGIEFSTALEKYPKAFSRLFTSMMRASEVSGTMGEMLIRVSDYLASERETRKKVKGALIYPACMLSFCLLVVIGLLVFVLPKFEKIYSGKGATLPLPTRALLAMSHGITGYWPFIIAGLVGAGVGIHFYVRSPGGRMMMDRIRISVPILGQMYRKAYLARSLRTMATMVSSGVSILDGLEITARVAGNYFYQKIWTGAAERVVEGATLSDPLFECRLIPRSVTQMISAGERTGKLAYVMNRVATFCEDDLKVAVKTVTQMIEPLMIIVMGLVIGGIAIALLLPVFSVSKIISGR